jgi:hypothetical protein
MTSLLRTPVLLPPVAQGARPGSENGGFGSARTPIRALGRAATDNGRMAPEMAAGFGLPEAPAAPLRCPAL